MKLVHKIACVKSPDRTLAHSFDFADNLVLNKLFSVGNKKLILLFLIFKIAHKSSHIGNMTQSRSTSSLQETAKSFHAEKPDPESQQRVTFLSIHHCFATSSSQTSEFF